MLSRLFRRLFALTLTVTLAVTLLGTTADTARAQSEPNNDLPNPYQSTDGWAKMPVGRHWGATSSIDVDPADANNGPLSGSSGGEGVVADADGVIYSAEEGPRAVKRYVRYIDP